MARTARAPFARRLSTGAVQCAPTPHGRPSLSDWAASTYFTIVASRIRLSRAHGSRMTRAVAVRIAGPPSSPCAHSTRMVCVGVRSQSLRWLQRLLRPSMEGLRWVISPHACTLGSRAPCERCNQSCSGRLQREPAAPDDGRGHRESLFYLCVRACSVSDFSCDMSTLSLQYEGMNTGITPARVDVVWI